MQRISNSFLLLLLTVLLGTGCVSRKPDSQIATPGPGDTEWHGAAQTAEPPPSPASEPDAPAAASPPPRARMGRGARKAAPHRDWGADAIAEEGTLDDSYSDGRTPMWRRPGLATVWGEQRDSHIREVSFTRGSYSPQSTLSLHYDDEAGIRAATGRSTDHAYDAVFPVIGGALTVAIVDDDGDALPGLVAGGQPYIFGDHGDRYQIRITNNTPGRFEIVASVDGLDVIDGQEGSFTKRGYIVNPWSTLDIDGFRDSADSVRAFRFGSVEDSYAARRGKGMNIGVIGVALFAERGFYFPRDSEVERRRRADPFPGRFAPPPPGSW